MTRLALNLAAFQVGWFSCVLGAANGYPFIGPVVVAMVVAMLAALSLGWAFVVPVLIALSRHFDGMRADAQVVNGPTAERAHV
jgi:hypothetical protein